MAYFLKITKQQSRTYLSIYESFYSPETMGTKHRSYRSLGNIQKLIDSGIDDPIAHFQKEVNRLNAQRKAQNANRKINNRLIGEISPEKFLGYFPLANIMNNLDVREHFDYLQSNRHFHFNVYDFFTSLVYARLVAPLSKHRTFHDIMPSMFSAPQDSYYQLLDAVEFLGEEYQKIIEILTVATDENYGIDTSHSYFDCTNFYFEIDRENSFQRKGPSKENRKDPIVGLGLLLDANMIPVGMEMYPGNESEQPVFRNIISGLKKRNNIKGRTIRVADKGLNSARNIIDSINCRDGYIFSKSVKKLPEVERTWVLLDNDYKEVKDSDGNVLFKHKSCIEEYTYSYTDDDGREFIKKVKEKKVATYNPKLHKKRVFEINKMVEKARKMKAYQAKKEEYGESAKYVTFKGKDGSKAEVMLNEDAIERDMAVAGYNLIVTSEYDMDDQKIYETYHNLWRIEESFRVMKSELDARPVYLQKENSIKGHFLICYTAVLLLRIFQFKVLDNKYSTNEICEFIKSFKIVEINNNRYINITRSTPFIRELAGLLNQPITNYYLTAKQIKMMLTR